MNDALGVLIYFPTAPPALQAEIDRGYDDYVEGRISDALWAPPSAE